MTSCNLHWDPNNVLFTKLAHWDGNFVRTEATASGFNFGILLAGNGCEVSLDCWANSCSNPGWWVTWLICDKLKGTSWGLSGKFLCHRWFAGRSECRNGQWLKYWQWITTLFWLWIRNHKRQSNWYQWRRSTFYFLTKKIEMPIIWLCNWRDNIPRLGPIPRLIQILKAHRLHLGILPGQNHKPLFSHLSQVCTLFQR